MERTLLVWVGHQSVLDMKSIMYFSTDFIFFMQMLHWHSTAADDISTLQPHDPLDPAGPWEDSGVFQWLAWLKVLFVLERQRCRNTSKLSARIEGDASLWPCCIAKQLFPAFNFNSLRSTDSMLMFAVFANIVICKVYNIKLKRGLLIGSMFLYLNTWNHGWLQMLLWVYNNIPI